MSNTTTTTTDWPFGSDALRDDPLTGLRIAVTSINPRWRYLVAFDIDSEYWPTDVEARLLLAAELARAKARAACDA